MADLSRREFAALAAAAAAAPFAGVMDIVRGSNHGARGNRPHQEAHRRRVEARLSRWREGRRPVHHRQRNRHDLDGDDGGASASRKSWRESRHHRPPDVLRESRRAGSARAEATSADPVFTAKNEFITRNNLVVFRLSDHWRQTRPDPLGGHRGCAPVVQVSVCGRSPTLRNTSAYAGRAGEPCQKRLRSRGGIRVIGDPRTMMRRVGLLPGTTPIQAALRMLPNVDVIVAGEVREWESVEYVRDKVFSGEKKGLILVGRIVSEEPGMEVCANWLKTFVPEVPIRHVSAGDPYWRPSDDRRRSHRSHQEESRRALARYHVSGHLQVWRARD